MRIKFRYCIFNPSIRHMYIQTTVVIPPPPPPLSLFKNGEIDPGKKVTRRQFLPGVGLSAQLNELQY